MTSIAQPSLSKLISRKETRLLLGALAAVLALTVLTEGTFLTARNLTNLTRQVAINGTIAVGMTYVILLGGIDLSVGSVVAFAGVVAGLCQVNLGLSAHGTWGALLTLIGALSAGALAGGLNALMISRLRIPPFIITLGMMVIARGLALILSNGSAIAPLGDSFNELGQGYFPVVPSLALVCAAGLGLTLLQLSQSGAQRSYAGAALTLLATALGAWIYGEYRGLPVPVAVFGALAILGHLILKFTRAGRFVLATGGNPDAAWLAGVPIQSVSFSVYLAMGIIAGLCGAILSARLNGALPTSGELFELDAIAAVVIGGTSLRGGLGSVAGSVMGAFLIGALNNGMSLLDVTEFYQKVFKGLIIVGAVWYDSRATRA